jgi:hypothetical protein
VLHCDVDIAGRDLAASGMIFWSAAFLPSLLGVVLAEAADISNF